MQQELKCKHGDKNCMKYWYCDKCKSESYKEAVNKLTPKERAYDAWATSPERYM